MVNGLKSVIAINGKDIGGTQDKKEVVRFLTPEEKKHADYQIQKFAENYTSNDSPIMFCPPDMRKTLNTVGYIPSNPQASYIIEKAIGRENAYRQKNEVYQLTRPQHFFTDSKTQNQTSKNVSNIVTSSLSNDPLSSKFEINGAYLTVIDGEGEDQQAKRVCNGRILDVHSMIVHSRVKTTDYFVFTVLCSSMNKTMDIEVPKCNLTSAVNIFKRAFPQFAVYDVKSFQEYLTNTISTQNAETVTSVKYDGMQGWYHTELGYRYLFDGLRFTIQNTDYICENAEATLVNDPASANEFLQLCPQLLPNMEDIYAIFLYTLYGHCASLLANTTPMKPWHSLLYFVGRTQSGKTTLAECFNGALATEKSNTKLMVDSTEASSTDTILRHQDEITLVDDLYPRGLEIQVKTAEDKVSKIIRMVGDGLAPAKMGPDRKPIPNSARRFFGGVIVTAEYYNANVESSTARILQIKLDRNYNRVNFDAASTITTNRLEKAFYSKWVLWLEHRQNIIEKVVSEVIDGLKAQNKDISRLTNTFDALHIMSVLFEHYCYEEDIVPPFPQSEKLIASFIEKQAGYLHAQEPYAIAKNAFFYADQRAKLSLSKSKADYMLEDTDGYVEDDTVFLSSVSFNRIVSEYKKEYKIGMEFNAIIDDCYYKGLLLEDHAVRFTKKRKVGTARPEMWQLNRSHLSKILGLGDDCDE